MSHSRILETKVRNESYGTRNFGASARVQLSFSKRIMKIIKCRDGP